MLAYASSKRWIEGGAPIRPNCRNAIQLALAGTYQRLAINRARIEDPTKNDESVHLLVVGQSLNFRPQVNVYFKFALE